MNDKEIKEAVEKIGNIGIPTDDIAECKARTILEDLGRLYLSIAEKMLEERTRKIFPDGARNLTDYDNGYNQARQECIILILKIIIPKEGQPTRRR